MALILASCKSAEEKRPGEYIIESFVFQGADSLAYLQRYNMDGTFYMADLQSQNFRLSKKTWDIHRENPLSNPEIGDSIIVYSGAYQYPVNDKEIRFMIDKISITVFNGRTFDFIYFDHPRAGTYQPPLLVEGLWKVKKEGQQTLILELKADKNTRLNLRRVNN